MPVSNKAAGGKIPLGVSQCLLGEPVRYNGDHKRDEFLCGVLAHYVSFRPLCPELAIGLGVPRPPIQLVLEGDSTQVRFVTAAVPSIGMSEDIYRSADNYIAAEPDICGYVLMQKSPSCGLVAVKRYNPAGELVDSLGQGAFAQRLQQLMPYLPVEEAASLADSARRDTFLARVFALYDYRCHVEQNPSPHAFVAFYSRYKYQVMAHHVPSYKALGRYVAQVTSENQAVAVAEFRQLLMDALARPASCASHGNALEHLRGYLKRQLNSVQQQQLSEVIACYRQGELPLSGPRDLLKQYVDQSNNAYLQAQSYWQPYPRELAL